MAHHRYEFLDSLRGIAAVMVVIFHFTQHGNMPLAQNAYFAVDLFFCLSGFVIAKAYAEKIHNGSLGFADFLKKRVRRLYPMFLLGTLLGVVSLLVARSNGHASYSILQIAGSAALNLLYIPYPNNGWIQVINDTIPSPLFPANNPSWTLFFEMVVNVLFFWLWKSGRLTNKTLMTIIALSAMIFAVAIYLKFGSSGWRASPRHVVIGLDRTIFGFAVGVLIARIERAYIPSWLNITAAIALIVAVIGIGLLPGDRWAFAIAVIAAPVIVYLGTGVVGHNPAFRWAGELSYPIYCIHFPILLVMSSMGFLTSLTAAVAGVVIAIVIATVATVWIEIPVRDRRR